MLICIAMPKKIFFNVFGSNIKWYEKSWDPAKFFYCVQGQKHKQLTWILFRSSHQRCSENKVFFPGKRLCWSLFLIKLQSKGQQLYYKDTPTQMFSCEICETLKNTYFEQHLWTTGSVCLRLWLVIPEQGRGSLLKISYITLKTMFIS